MSLYEELGGDAAITATVNLFYEKVLGDPKINSFFEGLDMDHQKKMMRQFATFAFGGPNNYTGKGMRKAHSKLVENGLNEAHFDRVVEHFGATLKELGVGDEQIVQAANVVNSVRDDVLCR